MKKLLAIALLAVFALSTQAFAKKAYVNGIDPNYPPFAYVDEKTGQPAGFDVDSMNWIAKTMGFAVEHKPMAWDGIIPALLAKQIDMVASGMSITDKRRQQVDFSDPYWKVSRVFLVKKDSKVTPEDILSKPLKLGVAFLEVPTKNVPREEGRSHNTYFSHIFYYRTILEIFFTRKKNLVKEAQR